MRKHFQKLFKLRYSPLLDRSTVAQQGALLWVLAIATDKQLPLVPMLEAFADDARGRTRGRVEMLCSLLRDGTPLPEALDRLPGLLPADVVVAARIGAETGTLGAALRNAAVAFTAHQERTAASPRGVFVYLCALLTVLSLILAFVMYFIIPKFKKIFEDFGTELPGLTLLVIDVSDFIVDYFYLFLPFVVMIVWMLKEFGRHRMAYEGPLKLLTRFIPSLKSADILRLLSVVVDAGRPLASAVSTLARYHPDVSIRQRLLQVHNDMEHGGDLWESLTATGLLGRRDAAVLESSRRAGNLPWALKDSAERIDRNVDYRLNLLLEFGRPVLLVSFGIVVGIVAVGLFMPLVKLLNDLS